MSVEYMQPGESYGEAIKRCKHFMELGQTAIDAALETDAKFEGKDLSSMDFDTEIAEIDAAVASEQQSETKTEQKSEAEPQHQQEVVPEPELVSRAVTSNQAGRLETLAQVSYKTRYSHQKKDALDKPDAPDKADVSVMSRKAEEPKPKEAPVEAKIFVDATLPDDQQHAAESAADMHKDTRTQPAAAVHGAEVLAVTQPDVVQDTAEQQKIFSEVTTDAEVYELNPAQLPSIPDIVITQSTVESTAYEAGSDIDQVDFYQPVDILTSEIDTVAMPESVGAEQEAISEVVNELVAELIQDNEIKAQSTPEPEATFRETATASEQTDELFEQEVAKSSAEVYTDFVETLQALVEPAEQPILNNTSEASLDAAQEVQINPGSVGVVANLVKGLAELKIEDAGIAADLTRSIIDTMYDLAKFQTADEATPEAIAEAQEQLVKFCRELFELAARKPTEEELQLFVQTLSSSIFAIKLEKIPNQIKYADASEEDSDDGTGATKRQKLFMLVHRLAGQTAVPAALAA